MTKPNLMGQTKTQLEELVTSMGGKAFGGRQLFKWMYKVRQFDFDLMTDLSLDVRNQLNEKYEIRLLKPEDIQHSKDNTIKYLFRLEDGSRIEAVLIPEEDRITVCISSQAGCQLNCPFCATGKMGFQRDLTVGEIIGQLMYLKEQHGENAFTNIVMMGMGEPLMNYENVIEASKMIMAHDAFNISYRKYSISTAGITPKIIELADSGIKLYLAVSLHSAIEAKRQQLVPIAKKYKLPGLIKAIKYYTEKTKTQVMFEYILFEGFNDTEQDIKALGKLFHGLPCKINILAYNPIDGFNYKRPSNEKLDWFGKQLRKYILGVTVRKSRGADINAACGLLAGKK